MMNRPSNAGKVSIRPQSIDKLDLSSKRLLVIGGTNGLGRAIAGLAMAHGADVTVVGRTLRTFPEGQPKFVRADLSLMADAARLGEDLAVEDFDVALFTAGIIAAPTREETAEGIERDMAVSFLNRVAVLKGLSGRLGIARPAGAPQARVFVMGSPGSGQLGNPDDFNSEELQYKALVAHANTIAGNEALALGANGMFPGPAYFGLGPGLIKTGIRENWMGRDGGLGYRLFEGAVGLFLQSPDQYARRVLPLLFTAELNGRTGIVFNRKGRPTSPSKGFDAAYVARVMNATNQLLTRALAGRDQRSADAREPGRNQQPRA
jgi:NAD(P)-dependent dehydrogenase (short-subunit alcohol dehydrogenase family)